MRLYQILGYAWRRFSGAYPWACCHVRQLNILSYKILGFSFTYCTGKQINTGTMLPPMTSLLRSRCSTEARRTLFFCSFVSSRNHQDQPGEKRLYFSRESHENIGLPYEKDEICLQFVNRLCSLFPTQTDVTRLFHCCKVFSNILWHCISYNFCILLGTISLMYE